MKTKKIFKIFTVITMLMLAIFTTGCESQQEKYTRACNDLASYETKFGEEIFKLANIGESSNMSEKEKVELGKKILEKANKYEKDTREKIENIQKIARGNPELEKDAHLKAESTNQKIKAVLIAKNKLETLIIRTEAKYKK